MCGRFTVLSYEELVDVVNAVEGHHRARLLSDGAERGHAKPGSTVRALVPGATRLEIATFTWGFAGADGKRLVFNTRIESALRGTAMWDGPIREGRCIVPVASFFEPHASEKARNPRTGRQAKRQYEFADADGEPLLLAGVSGHDRLSIVTTAPNARVAPIHARMPLALRFEEVPRWIDGDLASLAELADRSTFELSVHPEDDGDGSDDEGPDAQLSLF